MTIEEFIEELMKFDLKKKVKLLRFNGTMDEEYADDVTSEDLCRHNEYDSNGNLEYSVLIG